MNESNHELLKLIKFHEQYINKNICLASTEIVNHPTIVDNVQTSLAILIDLYAMENKWNEVFELVETINTFVQRSGATWKGLDKLIYTLGNFFYSINSQLYAYDYFKRAVFMSNESNLMALESLENLLNLNIDRWHFRMLNDKIRNKSYAEAIAKKLAKFSDCPINVLDIGTGTGLLSAQCLNQSKQMRLFACETNQFFYEISTKYLTTLAADAKVLNKHSNELSTKHDFDSQQIDLIVTEIFDDCLLGEHCLDTFYNALVVNRLLRMDDTCRIIPKRAKVFLGVIEAPRLRQSNYFNKEYKSNICRFICSDNSAQFEESDGNHEPYTTEDLSRSEFKFLCEPIELSECRVEFGNIEFLEKYCKHNETTVSTSQLRIETEGSLDACVIWFDLDLDDEISLTNSPRLDLKHKSSCWHQAVYNVSQEIVLHKDQILPVEIKLRTDCFLVTPQLEAFSSSQIYLNRQDIFMLNNQNYQSVYTEWFELELKKFSQKETRFSPIKLGVLSNSLNVLVLDILYKHSDSFRFEIVYFFNAEEIDASLRTFFEKNSQIQIIYLNELTNDLNPSVQFDLDYLICEPIDLKLSIIKKNFFSDLKIIKKMNSKKSNLFGCEYFN